MSCFNSSAEMLQSNIPQTRHGRERNSHTRGIVVASPSTVVSVKLFKALLELRNLRLCEVFHGHLLP